MGMTGRRSSIAARSLAAWLLVAIVATGNGTAAATGAAGAPSRRAGTVRGPATTIASSEVLAPVLERLGGGRLVIASKTGMYTIHGDGRLVRGSGGVVTALGSLPAQLSWIAAPSGEGDLELAARGAALEVGHMRLRFPHLPPEVLKGAIDKVSNPILWFTHHPELLPYLRRQDEALWDGAYRHYRWANLSFASTIAEELDHPEASSHAMVHDYQLYLVPKYLRRLRPNALIMHFTHIPGTRRAAWAELGREDWGREIHDSLTYANLIGLQTRGDAAAFVDTASSLVPGLRTESDGHGGFLVSRSIRGRPHRALVRHYPISIDPERVLETYDHAFREAYPRKAEVQDHRRSFPKLVVKIDRLDPSKRTLEALEAYRQLLRRRPQLVGKVGMLVILVPSRENVEEYAAYKQKVLALIDEINGDLGQRGRRPPILSIAEHSYERALHVMGEADVLVANSIDGMHLVSKEFSIVNRYSRSRYRRGFGVLLLSPTVGAKEELGDAALDAGITAEETSHAMERALAMDAPERARRALALAEIVAKNTVAHWQAAQLRDLAELE